MRKQTKQNYEIYQSRDGGFGVRDDFNPNDDLGNELVNAPLPIFRTAEHAQAVCDIFAKHGFLQDGPWRIGCSCFGLPPELKMFLQRHNYISGITPDEIAAIRFLKDIQYEFDKDENLWITGCIHDIVSEPFECDQTIFDFVRDHPDWLKQWESYDPHSKDRETVVAYWACQICSLVAEFRQRWRLDASTHTQMGFGIGVSSSLAIDVADAWSAIYHCLTREPSRTK